MYRHNGLAIMAGMMPALLLFFWPYRRKVLLAILVCVSAYAGVRGTIKKAYGVAAPSTAQATMDVWQLANLVVHDVPLAADEEYFLSRCNYKLFLKERWSYGPDRISGLHTSTTGYYLADHLPDLQRLRGSLRRRYPLLFLRDYFMRHQYLLNPVRSDDMLLSSAPTKLPNRFTSDYGIEEASLFPWGKQKLLDFGALSKTRPYEWIAWRPALHLWLTLGVLAVLLFRRQNLHLAVVFLPVLLNTAGLFLVNPNGQVRYQFPLTLCLGFLVCLAFRPRDTEADRSGGSAPPSRSGPLSIPGHATK